MRKTYYFLVIGILLIAFACKKGNPTPSDVDNGCISQITRSYAVNAKDSAAAAQLLIQNNLPVKGLTFTRVILNDTIVNSFGTNVYQQIFALQNFNGLLLFNNDLSYYFKNGVYDSSGSAGVPYTSAINLNTTPHLTLPQVRKLYVDAAAADYPRVNIKDSCLVAQFGYDYLTGAVGAAPTIVKVWYVTPLHSAYPYAYIEDDNSTVLVYFNGLYLFKQD